MSDEAELIQKLNIGDEEALKAVFDKYYKSLCLYAESIVKNHQVAEEIVEDIFIYIWSNCKSINIHLSIKNYLYRSTHNNCLKYLQKLKKTTQNLENWQYCFEDKEILYPNLLHYPIANLIVKELENKAEEILDSLPEQCKNIYMLNRFEDLSYSKIAEKLNVTVGTVKAQMSRAFSRFRKGLKDYIS